MANDAVAIAASLSDPGEFAVVFDRHWEALHAFCRSRAGTAGEDIAAESFRVAFDRRRRYDLTYADARPWLYGIASNLVRDHFRKAERGARAGRRSLTEDFYDRVDETLGRVEAESLGPRLAAALEALPPADRDALLLLAWAGLTYDEIARALAIPIGTVRSRIHRARARVQAHLTREDIR
jgi:RNA polymerase sigma factor (sigma-70 family)